jgi:hypothetical protein
MQPRIGANSAAMSDIDFTYCIQSGDEIITAETAPPTFSLVVEKMALKSDTTC